MRLLLFSLYTVSPVSQMNKAVPISRFSDLPTVMVSPYYFPLKQIIYGQVKITTVKIYSVSMGLFRLCFDKKDSSASYLEARLAASHISCHIDR